MFKRKPSRSREFRKNSQVIDMAEERELRRERRAQKRIEEEQQQRLEEEKKLSARKKKQRRNRSLVYIALILVIVGLLAYSAADIVSLKLEQRELLKKNQELKEIKEAKQNELENSEEDAYVEQKARETLKLIKPGETLYVLPPVENATTEEAIDGNSGDR